MRNFSLLSLIVVLAACDGGVATAPQPLGNCQAYVTVREISSDLFKNQYANDHHTTVTFPAPHNEGSPEPMSYTAIFATQYTDHSLRYYNFTFTRIAGSCQVDSTGLLPAPDHPLRRG